MKSNIAENEDKKRYYPNSYQLKHLFIQIFKPHLLWALGAFIFLLLTVLITLSLPIMARYIIDGYAFNIETGQKYLYVGCALVATAAFGTAVRFYMITLLGERLVSDLRQALFDQIINLSPNFFEKKSCFIIALFFY